MKLIGMILLTVCGSCIGVCVSAAFRRKTAMLVSVADMLLSFSIKLQYGSPTVGEMISEVCGEMAELPAFLQKAPEREAVIEAIKEYPDGLEQTDVSRLSELFTQLGSADRDSELCRLRAAREYFLQRIASERPKNEKRAQLARRLGVLLGIFAAIMLL